MIAAGDFGPKDRRCGKVQGPQEVDRAQVSGELGSEMHRSSCSYTAGLTLEGEVAGSSRHVAQERTQATARPGNCRENSGEGVPCELCR